jgi:hypothetical protein
MQSHTMQSHTMQSHTARDVLLKEVGHGTR